MAIKPILFNTEMIRAILDGRKTVTRRVMKPQPMLESTIYPNIDVSGKVCAEIWGNGVVKHIKQPYHRGDFLWVREMWRLIDFDYIETDWSASVQYRTDLAIGERWHDLSPDERLGWHPAIHMPREAARIWLRVTDVRVERLQEISTYDTLHEGVVPIGIKGGDWEQWQNDYMKPAWDSTVKPVDRERYGWAANPWVWVIEFERCEKPEGF